MRVLFYNWVGPLDPERRGGGVAAYQRHLTPALKAAGITVAWLQSGLAQDLRPRPPRWEQTAPGQYRLVNARPLAPSHHSFGDAEQIDHPETLACFEAFLKATGPWDVIHFDNLEGLPARALRVARAHAPRVVLMLHNYYPFCPQVNLWFQERETCRDFDNGRACLTCLPHAPAPLPRRRMALAVAHGLLEKSGPKGVAAYRRTKDTLRSLRARKAVAQPDGLPPIPAPLPGARSEDFAARRAEMVALLNETCDAVLCVSDRVRQIAEGFGVSPAIARTCRIGSPDAGRKDALRPMVTPAGGLTLAYLGYMRRDKGFFFLLSALEALPAELAAKITLILAAKASDPATLARVMALKTRLAGLTWHDGYRPADLDRILAPATLGVVPVLWEDNLPQVALEMHLRGIALLTSDLGGARELGNCPELTFPAGDADAFAARLQAVLQGDIATDTYGQGGAVAQDMTRHLQVLQQNWQGQKD